LNEKKFEIFYCEQNRCNITVSGCMRRQERAAEGIYCKSLALRKVPYDEKCVDCAQGKEMAKKANGKLTATDIDKMLEAKDKGELPEVVIAPEFNEPERLRHPTKICRVCKEDIPLTAKYWHRKKDSADGFAGICKKCKAKQNSISGKKMREEVNRLKTMTEKPEYILVDLTRFDDCQALVDELASMGKDNLRDPKAQATWELAELLRQSARRRGGNNGA
jgi:hypothetical protein